ncbi:MAG: tyrosine-protein phosphatase [Acetivibrionales bacterium]|jgi:protein-tyrosine phosphatase
MRIFRIKYGVKMIDLHSHVLYGLDDGAENEEMTLNMLRIAHRDGITRIIATPHFICGENLYNAETLEKRLQETIQLAKKNNIDVELYPGNEIYLDEYALDNIKNGQCSTLAGSRYVLVELPMAGFLKNIGNILYNILGNGYIPVLAHVERYEYFRSDLKVLKRFLEMGCISQINATSINGIAGTRAQKAAREMLIRNMGHVVASDAHTDRVRVPRLSKALETVKSWLGEERARNIFYVHPEAILRNESFQVEEPPEIRKKLFHWFR